jgi:thymidylate synthase
MNQMEAFKSEQKRLAATTKDKDKEKMTKEKDAEERKQREKAEIDDKAREQTKQENDKREKELNELEKLVLQQARKQGNSVPEITSFPTIEIVTVTASPSISTTPSPSVTFNDTIENIAADQNKTTTSTSSSSRIAPPRSDSSESIYAHIIRRLNALEGNSSLVARYIEEQAKVMRHMLSRVEKGWDDWQVERELDELSRWEQEVGLHYLQEWLLIGSACGRRTDSERLFHRWSCNE